MRRSIQEYVARCEFCIKFKPKNSTPMGLMGYQRMVTAPMQILSSDLIHFLCVLKCLPYHPQANPTERQNKTLKTIISSYIGSLPTHRTWDYDLKKYVSAMNSAVGDVTHRSPNYHMFGRDIRLDGREWTESADELKESECEDEVKFRKMSVIATVMPMKYVPRDMISEEETEVSTLET
ncbi:hypothetical protein FOCC_FOCC012808 [Frankliniella occidentalis]|nr:hypothetical protein FOCC_FOCC012808 [Frankliniella occidentalis]